MSTLSKINFDELIAKMESYRKEHPSQGAIERRYRLKEVGAHCLIDQLKLESPAKQKLKEVVSTRICMEEALAAQVIPAAYLGLALSQLPSEIQNLDLCSTYRQMIFTDHLDYLTDMGEAALRLLKPGPFDPNGRESYIAVRQEGIVALIKAVKAYASAPLKEILNTRELNEEFERGGIAIANYLDTNLSVKMGSERN